MSRSAGGDGGSDLPSFGDPGFFTPPADLIAPEGADEPVELDDFPIDGPDSISRDDFEQLVVEGISSIPEEFREQIENVVFLIEDENPDEPELLGLYEGVPITERDDYAGAIPDAITIYRLPLLEMCHTAQEVRDEVRITVIHEVGHYFGIDDDRLHELGWG